MKITTWNIRHGGGANRIEGVLHELQLVKDSDIIVLTEFRNNSFGKRISAHLSYLGYKSQFSPSTDSNTNTVLVASKIDLEFSIIDELNEHSHRIVRAANHELILYGAYFPQREKKAIVFSHLEKHSRLEKEELPIVITGDLNTGLHFIDEAGKQFYCTNEFIKLLESGFVDAWRVHNGDTQEFSWYSNSGNGFRLDHFLVSAKQASMIVNCLYIHKPREIRVSDHSIMSLQLSIE